MQCLASVIHQVGVIESLKGASPRPPRGPLSVADWNWIGSSESNQNQETSEGLELASARARSDSPAVLWHCTQLCDLTPLRGRQTNRRVPRNQRCPSGQTRARGNGNSWLYDKLLPRESGVAASSLTFRGQIKQEDSISRRGRAQGSIEQRLVATLAPCNGLFGGSRP